MDCAGIPGDFICRRCGREARRHRDGCCERCILIELLRELLDDGTGQVRPALLPLFNALRQMRRPRSGHAWASRPEVQHLLRTLACDHRELSHQVLNQLPSNRAVTHLRDLLMHHGVLPPADRDLLRFETWLTNWLPTLTDPEHHQLLELFARWHILRRLRAAAARTAIGHNRDKQARLELRRAATFLTWLTEHNLTLTECTQATIDGWQAEDYLDRRHAHPFLRWCITTNRLRPLRLPSRAVDNPAPIAQHRRLTLIRRLLTQPQLSSTVRVAGLLILLYAQPATRIVKLRLDDITSDHGHVFIRLGDPPSPVPDPFAALLLEHAQDRPNTHTATNPTSPWLFPGRRAGQPIGPTALLRRLTAAGIPPLHARTSAMRQLVLQAPPSVAAGMLGYQDTTATRHAEQAGQPWHRYAPGDHTRTDPPATNTD